jgi:hypothetical protein
MEPYEIQSLIASKADVCISIYLPTYRKGADIQQNRIRFKQLVKHAEQSLIERDWTKTKLDNFFQPLNTLLKDQFFWTHPIDGFACFLSADLFFHYRLPFPVLEQVLVDRRFLIRPLLPLIQDRKFFVLAMSENELRFLQASMFQVEESQVKTLPRNLADAIRFNDPERQLQLHTQTPRTPGARAAAIFHGHGVGIDDEKDDLQEYCRQIDRGLHLLLKEQTAPLVVAATESLFSTYAKRNTYPHLLLEPIPGNPELLSNEKLHDRARDIVSSYFAQETKQLLQKYEDLSGTNLVTNNAEEVLHAARQGRIQHLLINSTQPWWGQYFEETGRIETHEVQKPDDTEIVNLAIIESLHADSKVHVLEPFVPEHPALLAIYRY